MSKIRSCPDPLALEDLLRGELSEDDAEIVGAHILTCHSCALRLNAACTDDPIAELLRDGLDLSLVDNPVADALIERLVDIPADTVLMATPSGVSLRMAAGGLRYQILRTHDKGGLGEVFVAFDQELNRQVALKEIQEHHAADPDSRGRFVREAEITGGLEHPGIVPVYGLGQYADGRPFYAMRFIQGETLKDAIARYHRTNEDGSGVRSPEFELRALLTRFVAVCNTIAYAHSRGVIHRDLKPANIMLGKYGETLVVDWGLAKSGMNEPNEIAGAESPQPTLAPCLADGIETQAGVAIGTPAYMSPEQASGQLDLLGAASDIYSLGATLYTLVTGKPPIEGKDTLAILRKARRGEWLPPRQVNPDVPAALDAICCKAMASAASARYLTALALAADVERWLADEPVAVYRESGAARSRRWMRRHRTLVSTAVGVLLVALLGTTVGLVFISEAWDKEATARQTADSEKAVARKQKEEARYNEYVAEMNLAQNEYEANNLGRVRELLAAQVPKEPDAADWRNFEWYYWQRMAHRELLVFKGHSDWVYSVALSPDGRRLASASRDHTVRLWDATTGQELLMLKGHTGAVLGVPLSPDGRRLSSASADRTVHIWDASTGQQLHILKGHTSSVWVASFSPDGRRLASASGDQTVRVWDAATGEEQLTLKGHTNECFDVSFSPDGRRLASASGDQSVKVWDAASGKELLTIPEHSSSARSVAFSADGRRLISASKDHTVRVWDSITGKELRTFKGHTGMVWAAAISSDGRRLASAGADHTVRVWDAATGQELLTLKGHTSAVLGVSFSPDGRRLISASQDHTVRLWDAATGQEALILNGHQSDCSDVSFSPDGRRLASASYDRTVRIWDAANGRQLLALRGHTNGIRGVSFSPDGRWLASASVDQTVRLWDAATGEQLLVLKGHAGYVYAVAFSPDGQRLASGSEDHTVRVWDAASGIEVLALKGHTGPVSGVSFSPDGRLLASASADQTVRLWDAATGEELLTLKGHTGIVYTIAFSPDGRRLASASEDQTVRVWGAASGKELFILNGHTNLVHGVSFSPDGRRLASASDDQTVRLWDAATGKDVLTLKGHTREVWGVSFSPDGRRLASAGLDRTVRVWETLPVPAVVWRQRELVRHVNTLFEELLLCEEVLTALCMDPTLDEDELNLTLAVAQSNDENPESWNVTAWLVVRDRNEGKEAYARAFYYAECANRRLPKNGLILNTLGAAQYRLGRYADALESLTKSEKINTSKEGSHPDDLVFLAMVQHQLGKNVEAKALLGRLRETLKLPRWAQYAESLSFLREAEELIEVKAASKGQ